ncbi:MAG: hypothetical protein ABIG39_02485 [Candidatus Micrarchaeota archaeon]
MKTVTRAGGVESPYSLLMAAPYYMREVLVVESYSLLMQVLVFE